MPIAQYMKSTIIVHLVTDPVQSILALTEILHQFLGLQETDSLLFSLLQQQVPQTVKLL